MNMKPLLAGVAVAAISSFASVHAESITPAEKDKIEALIRFVETLKDSSFIRNGKVYEPKDAAQFLRGKWTTMKDEIRTVDDFINKVATVSGSTGQPYLIRFSDGKEMKLSDYLRTLLAKANAGG